MKKRLFILLLMPAALFAEDNAEVVVTATRTERDVLDVPITTQVITREDIKRASAESVADILENQAGVVLERGFEGRTLSLQGLDSKYTLVLIDGQRVNGRVAGTVDLERFSLENVERIEIVKGASSSLYGADAMGGVVNIITKKTKNPVEASARASYGTLNAIDSRAQFGLAYEHFTTRFFGSYRRRDAFDLKPEDIEIDGSKFYRYSIGNKSQWLPDKKTTYTIRGEYRQNKTETIDESTTSAIYDITNLDEEVQSVLSYDKEFSSSKLSLSGSYFYFRSQYLQDQRRETTDTYEETIDQTSEANLKYTFLFLDNHLMTLGGNGIAELLSSDRLDGKNRERYRGAGYAQDEWLIFEKHNGTLVPGVRYDYDSQFGQNVAPKIAGRFDFVKDKVISRASYGWGFRAPDFRQLYLVFENPGVGYRVQGNTNLKPERSQNITGGLEVRPFKWLSLESSYFRNELENLIDTQILEQGSAGSLTLYSYINVKNALTQGVENQLRIRFASFKFIASYTYTDAIDESANTPLPGRPKHRGSLSLQYNLRKYGLALSSSARFVGRRPFNINEDQIQQDEIIFAQPYVYWDARASLNLRPYLKTDFDTIVFSRAENLLNEGNATYLPVVPRSFFAGLEIRYNAKLQNNPKQEKTENENTKQN